MEKLNLDISEGKIIHFSCSERNGNVFAYYCTILRFSDSKLIIAIQLLSYMISPKQRVKQKSSEKTKQYSEASIVLSRYSMIKCANVSTLMCKVFIQIHVYIYLIIFKKNFF